MERLARALVEYLHRLEPRLRRLARGVNDHLQDAGASVLANVGEALDDPNPADKRRFFGYALRSGGECQRLLRAAAATGAVTEKEAAEGLRLILDIKMDLLRLRALAARETRQRSRR